ncbi:MAG: c-type cytochrome domain-containing protein [Syntrophomonadaceae bacterium]
MKYNILFAVVFLAIAIIAGCKDTVTNQSVDEHQIPSKNVSYNNDIQPLFEVKCNNSGCHDDQSRAGGISLTSYQNTTSDPTMVVAGYPDNSRLIWVIQPGASNQMPPIERPQLTKNQRDGIATWIKEGAKPN